MLESNKIYGSIAGQQRQESSSAASLIIPKATDSSRYDPSWEPYIAANVTMYAVPLALFIRRASEFDFGEKHMKSSVDWVKKVFRVFTPDVIQAIARHLPTSSGAVPSSKWPHFVDRHISILGPYAPPAGELSLSSCKNDMRGLLEEIYMQHMKKVRDLNVFERFFARCEGLFGKGVVLGEENELNDLVERAKLIVGLPIDFEIVPSGPATGTGAMTGREQLPIRAHDGVLTEVGRNNLIHGQSKCERSDVAYVGDKMRAQATSHEISILVQASIWLSDRLNEKFKLPKKNVSEQDESTAWWEKFRLNLRFLADYRNLLVMLFLIYFRSLWLRPGVVMVCVVITIVRHLFW